MPQRVRFTYERCLEAVRNFLKKELGYISESSKVVFFDSSVWLEFKNVRTESDAEDSELIPVVRSLLCAQQNIDESIESSSNVILICLHDSDPTPIVRKFATHTAIDRFYPLAELALVSTPAGIEALPIVQTDPVWGERRVWPFTDQAR